MRSFLIAGLTALVIALPAGAADRAIGYLSREPVTLLDWGLIRLESDLSKAAAAQFANFRTDETRAGAYYEWRSDRIVAYVTLAARYDLRTEANCRAAFREIVQRLTYGAPAGVSKGGWYLESVFTHVGRRGIDRPHDLQEQLSKMVSLEVALRAREREHAAGDWLRVSCAGGLDAQMESIDVVMNGAIQ